MAVEDVQCDVCEKSFETKDRMLQHKNDAHRAEKTSPNRKPFKLPKTLLFGGMIVFLVAMVVYWAVSQPSNPSVGEIKCSAMEATNYHVHSHIDIFINGQPYTIPSGVGIIPNVCFYWLHMHDSTGVIHIEAPEYREFTLGQFFKVWNKPFNNTRIFDNVADSNNSLAVYVDGQKVNGNYPSITLGAHKEIAIVYGTSPSTIPSSYDFPVGS